MLCVIGSSDDLESELPLYRSLGANTTAALIYLAAYAVWGLVIIRRFPSVLRLRVLPYSCSGLGLSGAVRVARWELLRHAGSISINLGD